LEEVASIKGELIGLMIAVPPAVQNQLGEAISIIAESDFWEQWETLIDVWKHFWSFGLPFAVTDIPNRISLLD
jgi:hypothetical protein